MAIAIAPPAPKNYKPAQIPPITTLWKAAFTIPRDATSATSITPPRATKSSLSIFKLPAEVRILLYECIIPPVPTSEAMRDYSGLFLSCHEIKQEIEHEVLKKIKAVPQYIATIRAAWPPSEEPLHITDPSLSATKLSDMKNLQVGIPHVPSLYTTTSITNRLGDFVAVIAANPYLRLYLFEAEKDWNDLLWAPMWIPAADRHYLELFAETLHDKHVHQPWIEWAFAPNKGRNAEGNLEIRIRPHIFVASEIAAM